MPVSDAWIDFVAGWCSGAASVIALQPVDTILTRTQAGVLAWNTNHGVQALWKGSSPMITAVPVQNALLMGGYGVGQKYAAQYAPNYKLTAVFIGGCTGGVLQSFLMAPVEGVKVSQQVQGSSLSNALQRFSLSRGLGATLLRDGIPHGVWFASYEVCKEWMMESQSMDGVTVPLVSGAVAAATAWAVGYPADLIKTRIQAGSDTGILQTAQLIVKEGNGSYLALYRGFGMKLVRSVPGSMIGFTVYEFVKKQVESL